MRAKGSGQARVRPSQVWLREALEGQVGRGWGRSGQARSDEVGSSEVGSSEVRSGEVGTGEVGFGEAGSSEVGSSQVLYGMVGRRQAEVK